MDGVTLLALGAAVVMAAAIGFLVGRFMFSSPSKQIEEDVQRKQVEIARYEERQKNLESDLADKSQRTAKLETEVALEREEKSKAVRELFETREKVAALEATAAAMSREREEEKSERRNTEGSLRAELKNGLDSVVGLQTSFAETTQKLAAATQLELELRGRITRAEAYIAERDARMSENEMQLGVLRDSNSGKDEELATLREREVALKRLVAERDEQLRGLQESLRVEFENMANKILTSATTQLSATSQTALASVLDPLRERISDFQKKVEDTYGEEAKQRFSLEKQIEKMVQANQTIGIQAENLTTALRADSQVRGRWGEIKLERVLEAAGLERGREFFLQGEGFEFRTEEGNIQRPDVVVTLPGDKHLIIDSKVSLLDYELAVTADSDDDHAEAVRRLKVSVRAHIDDLAGKNYQASKVVNSHDFVFMFMPIEGAMALVLQNDQAVFEYAWKKRVVIVSPANLLTTMKTVESIWRYEKQNQNAQKIAQLAGGLYDKLFGMMKDFNSVSGLLHGAAEAHNEAMKKLAKGQGNALGKAERLRVLGVKTKADLPAVLIDGEKFDVEAEDANEENGETLRLSSDGPPTSDSST